MSASLSGVWNAQNFTDAGLPASLYRLYTYTAGTTTQKTAYTDAAAAVPHTYTADGLGGQYIGLNARGELPAPLFFTTGPYDLALKTPAGATVWTRRAQGEGDGSDTLRSDLAASSGSSLSGFLQSGTGAVARTVQAKLTDFVSVLDFIPVSEHAAIKAYTSTLDVTDYFNAAIAASPWVRVPAGGYRVLRPINMSARRSASGYWGRHLIGEGANNTIIDAYTGNYPCIDCTGQNVGIVSGINFRSDNPPAGLAAADCASIGLQMGRGNVSQSCNQLYLFDLRFNLTSDMTRNAGNGTVGICNDASEHVIADQVQIYANLPIASHNGLQFAVSRSSNIPTYGTQYEQPYAGGAISNTIHEWRNMQLISWDSYRTLWFHQVTQAEMPNLYASTRKLVSSVPAQTESIYLTGSCTAIKVSGYQETSGLFGATYRMDHAYVTFGDNGFYEDIDITLQRAGLDMGFTLPGAAVASYRLVNGPTVSNCRLNCNYIVSTYVASADSCGFAANPINLVSGVPALRNLELVTDQSGAAPRSANIFSAVGQYSTNVTNRNWRSGDTRRSDGASNATNGNGFTPVAIGLSTAGAGTYTFQYGTFERVGGWCFFSLRMVWTAHTGTGGLAITGLPFVADANAETAVSVSYDTLLVAAGKQMTATIPAGQSRIILNQSDPSGGGLLGVQVDGTVAGLTLSGCYRITG